MIDDSNMIRSCGEMGAPEPGSGTMPVHGVEQRTVRDEVDEQLLPVFLEEANDLYPKICLTLQAWREQGGADSLLSNRLQRSLHTFKGSARMAGAMRLGELLHRIEGRIAIAIKQGVFDAVLWNELDNYLTRIAAALEELAGGAAADMQDIAAALLLHGETTPRAGESGLVAFASVSERLYRVARQTAKELGKRVNLELFGGEIELDAVLLEKLTAPFEHLLRNSIAHGIETPLQREHSGKPLIGEICLSLQQEGNELVFKFSDDGSGLHMAGLQQKALEQGVLQAGEQLSEAQAIQMIFKPGLSTAQEVTEIAGRGIGLDVVSSEVGALGGHLDVVSTPGKGLSFTIRLPAG